MASRPNMTCCSRWLTGWPRRMLLRRRRAPCRPERVLGTAKAYRAEAVTRADASARHRRAPCHDCCRALPAYVGEPEPPADPTNCTRARYRRRLDALADAHSACHRAPAISKHGSSAKNFRLDFLQVPHANYNCVERKELMSHLH